MPSIIVVCNRSFGQASHNGALDAAVILSAENLEGAIVAPVVVPGVGHQPVGRAILDAPAEEADGVAA